MSSDPKDEAKNAASPDPKSDDQDEKDRDQELGGRMSFIEHLEELRRRILVAAITFAGCFVVIYTTSVPVLKGYFIMPLQQVLEAMESTLIITGIAEGFVFELKLSAIAAVFVASPMIFYQGWAFVAPGLYKKERRYVGPFIFFSTFFFVGGAAFFYIVVYPIVASFFATFAVAGKIQWTPKLSEVFTFVTMMSFAFGLAFELPVAAFILAKLGVVNVSFLNKNRKYAILIILTAAAFFTPPDVISQLLLAGPMWVLYELSVLVVWIFGPKKKKEEAEAD